MFPRIVIALFLSRFPFAQEFRATWAGTLIDPTGACQFQTANRVDHDDSPGDSGPLPLFESTLALAVPSSCSPKSKACP